MKNRIKKSYQKHIRVNISLPPMLHEQADMVARKLGYSGFSAYVQGQLRRDAGLELTR